MNKIEIKGTIVANEDKWIYDYFGMDAVTPYDVAAALEDVSGDITVEISSPGGDVIAANEIYYAIATYPGYVTADIVGWAASAASYVALAADTVRIVPTGMFMIHNVSGSAYGDYHDMDKESKVLQTFNKAVSNAYRLKTGMTEAELLAFMDQESWLTATVAKEKGFVDEIIGDESGSLDNSVPVAVYNAGFAATIFPKDKIDALRKVIFSYQKSQKQSNADESDTDGTEDQSPPPGESADSGETDPADEPTQQNIADIAKLKKSILF